MSVGWSVLVHPEVRAWMRTLDEKTAAGVVAAIDALAVYGPTLQRPLADTLTGSAMKNLKELRPGSSGRSEVRILFAFDPARQAVLLVAGDRRGSGHAGISGPSRWPSGGSPSMSPRWKAGTRTMTEMTPWEQVRAETLESGQVSPDALAQAQVVQDAYVAGYRLAELRGKAGMTQTQLAEAMGVSQARISAMERGELD
ncbi:MAG: type II toxin-antitoxin system RelE/ParE family toxin, partial [Pseudonocardiaceae bacterium]